MTLSDGGSQLNWAEVVPVATAVKLTGAALGPKTKLSGQCSMFSDILPPNSCGSRLISHHCVLLQMH